MDAFISNVNRLILNPLIVLLFAIAFVYFLYGVLVFIFNQSSEEKKTTGKSHMLWGIIGLTIMMGVWAILNIVVNTFGLQGQVDPERGEVNLKD